MVHHAYCCLFLNIPAYELHFTLLASCVFIVYIEGFKDLGYSFDGCSAVDAIKEKQKLSSRYLLESKFLSSYIQ
jgi:hypothetical protein